MRCHFSHKIIGLVLFFMVMVTMVSGCAFVYQRGRQADVEQLEQLAKEREQYLKKFEQLKARLDQLADTRRKLEDRLREELADKSVTVSMQEKGLVITFLAEVLFDSGKADLRASALSILDKVARILKEEVPDMRVGVEGHTDNVPIKYSGWKSNWDLSAGRALSVLRYLESQGVRPERLSATGFGPYQPVASNAAAEGRQQNRRVEVVIYPERVTKKTVDMPKGVVSDTFK